MQVHAVPDSERAFDSTGRKLPWAYEFADSDQNQRRIPEEKGPFGKARKRGTSRAKTPLGASNAADEAKLHNQRAIDDIFGRYKSEENSRRSVSSRQIAALPPSASAPNLIDASNGLGNTFAAGASTNATFTSEPKEVILYGYGNDVQWAAIAHYEKVSGGLIYEEYDREPCNHKYGKSFTSQRASCWSLNKSALRKVNEFVGGNHWIKVTFDSAEAAERACHYSPKSIQGYTVYAEMYRGTGPQGGDREIRAEAGRMSQFTSPNTLSSGTVGPLGASGTSTTVSSATVTASQPAMSQGILSRPMTEPPAFLRNTSGAFPSHVDDMPVQPLSQQQREEHQALDPSTIPARTTTTALNPRSQRATLRLKGANVKPAVFLPQEKAFLPAKPRWQQTFGSLPIIGWVIGSGHGIIGDHVPRKDDGSFDMNSASLYWRAWYMVDNCFGSDFCGVRDAEYDE